MPQNDPLFNVHGKVIVLTGGNGVLCSAMARALAERGAKVGILGRNPEKTQGVVTDIQAHGGEALPLIADVTRRTDLEQARDQVLDTWGQIDVLINGAGGNMPGANIQPHQNVFDDLDFGQFQQVMGLNLDGTVLPTLVFGKVMAAQGRGGSIINISSMAANRAITRIMGYSAAKAAVDAFTRWLAVEVALKIGENIRVNAIAPGFFVTEQNRALLTQPDGSPTERGATVLRNTPVGRFGAPEELVGTCIWLCSDASRFVTGTIIPVDGGFSAWSGV